MANLVNSRCDLTRKHHFVFPAQIKLYFHFPCKDRFGVYSMIRLNIVQWIDEKSVILFSCQNYLYFRFPFSDGQSRAGVYCGANACIEQVIQHGEVDVFQAAKTVRRHRPQLVENIVRISPLTGEVSYFFLTRILIRINEEFIKNSVKLINQMTFEFLKYFDQKCDCKSRWPFIKKKKRRKQISSVRKHCTYLFQ